MKEIRYGRDAAQPKYVDSVDPEELMKKITSRLGDLDTMPFVYRKLLSILNSPFVSARDLGKVISTDQSLSIRVLRMVNSAYYGVTQRVLSVTQAVNMLGLNVVRSLCFCLASYDSFFAGAGNEQARLWKRSMGSGLVAKSLARTVGFTCPEEIFVAAMLHDIGYAVLRKFATAEYASLEARLRDAENPLEVERDFLGTDHAELGALTCQSWKLPELLVACVRYHHNPEEAGEYVKAATLVAVASQAWINYEDGTENWNEQHLESLGLHLDKVRDAVANADAEFSEIGNFVGVGARAS